jgi:hypothetical protein
MGTFSHGIRRRLRPGTIGKKEPAMTRSATIAASVILGLSSAFAQTTVDTDSVDISFTNPSWFVLSAGAAAITLDHTHPIIAGSIAGASAGSAIEYFLDDGATLSAQITDITRLGVTIAGFSASTAPEVLQSVLGVGIKFGAGTASPLWFTGGAWPSRTMVAAPAGSFLYAAVVAVHYDLAVDMGKPGFDAVTLEVTFTVAEGL